jgi:hypothetical protein
VWLPAAREYVTTASLLASLVTLPHTQVLLGVMSFQFTHVPASMRTQKESSVLTGAIVRPHTRYVPAVGTLNA